MQTALSTQLPTDFNDTSRVWIYQCNRPFTSAEAPQVKALLSQFAATWKSHGATVKGYAELFFHQFIIVMADETATGVSGCSTDSSVRVIKEIEQQHNVQLFDRQTLAFLIKEKIAMLPLSQLAYATEHNFITPETLYFNNIVQTKAELLAQWIIPVKDSWLATRVSFTPAVQA